MVKMNSGDLSKYAVLSGMFGALGNALAILSMEIGNLHPQIALDLSHLGTIAAAFTMGPWWGGLTGALVSVVPFVRFSLMGFMPISVGLLIFPGKAMTGVFVGLLRKRLRPLLAVPLGYVPESAFTYLVLELTARFVLPPEQAVYLTRGVILGILGKAWVEILVMAAISEVAIPRLLEAIRGTQ
ncbi:MAG TPA: hypothetical protein ENG69_02300 [Candidatus Korarchaeota archaeon]|nr:hypothetical protein [Candidatus Korarchaeota archaeon]